MLSITTTRNALKTALDAVTRIVETRNTIPILSNLLLDPAAKTVKATDLDIEATASFEMGAEGERGPVTLPARLLADIVGKMPDGATISLSMGDADRAILKSGRSRFTLQTLPPEDYPSLAGIADPVSFTLPAAVLARLLDKTAFAISTEETRYYLNGVHFHPFAEETGGYSLRAVATDGHRLSQVQSGAIDGIGAMPGVIVPRKTTGEMQRLLGRADKDAMVDVAVSKSRIRFAFGAIVLTSKLIDGTFPDYQRVIPVRNERAIVVDSEALAAAVDRVSTVSSERGHAARFEFAGGKLTIAVRNPDAGEAQDEVETEDTSEDSFVTGFNTRYLRDTLAALDSDCVTLRVADPGSPALITPGRVPGDILTVLMPMRAP